MTVQNVAICALLAVALPVSAGDDIPRRADGKPDFSGICDIASLTPFQQPQAHGESLYLGDDAVRKLEKAAADVVTEGDAPSDPNRPPPEKGADIGFYNLAWLDMGDSLFKIDGRYRSSILVDPPDGRMPALTEAGQARRSAGPSPRGPQPQDQNQIEPPDDLLKNDGTAWWLDEGSHPYDGPETLTLLDRCLLYADATIPMIPTMYNNMKTVVQTDTHLLINIEWMHWARIVRIDAEHLDPEIRSLAGDSIGWWEGDTLVVETTNFLEAPGVPRDGLRVVERLSPIDGDSLLYGFTVHDPDYAAPYSGELPWPKSDQPSYEYPGDLSAQAPNMIASTVQGAGTPVFGLRGVSMNDWSYNRSGPVAAYLDEGYKGNPSLLAVPFFDLERVEVLRGPQRTLYGKNTAPAGPVHRGHQLSRSTPYLRPRTVQRTRTTSMVERTVSEARSRIRGLARSPGALRLRKPFDPEVTWQVERFGAACHLRDFDVDQR